MFEIRIFISPVGHHVRSIWQEASEKKPFSGVDPLKKCQWFKECQNGWLCLPILFSTDVYVHI